MTKSDHTRISDLERDTKGLHNQLSRLEAELSAIRYEHKANAPSQQTPEEKGDSACREPSLAAKIPPSPPNSQRSDKPWYKTLKGWNTLLQMVGIPFAIGYALVTYNQWSDSQANFTANERAWVKIQYAWPDDKEMSAYHPEWPVSGKAGLWNEGKSVITRYYGEGDLEILDAKTPPSFTLGTFHSTYVGGPMFPTEESDFPVELFDQQTRVPRPFTQTEYDALRRGTKYIAMFGYLAYADKFGVHWYQFCSWNAYTTTRSDFSSGACVAFNKTGDGTALPFGKKYIEQQ